MREKQTRLRPWMIGVASLVLLAGIAWAIKPIRADAGLQETCQSAWTGPTGVAGTYYKCGSGQMVRNADNTETGPLAAGGGGSGTVTSVGMSLPGVFSVSGSPVTTSGTLTATLATEAANQVWAGPTTGAASAPTFRALVSGDIPDVSATYLKLTGGTMSGSVVLAGVTATGSNAFDFSGGSGTWKTSTGAHTFGSASWAVPANLVVTGSSSATNTVGMTHVANVTDGATSIAHLLNNTAALSTAGSELLSVRNNNVEFLGLVVNSSTSASLQLGNSSTGTFASILLDHNGSYIQDNFGILQLNTASNSIRLAVNTVVKLQVDASGVYAGAGDGTVTLGAASVRWKGVLAGAAAASQPTCDATTRGDMFPVFAASSSSDTFQVCMKAAADTYAWRTIFTAP